MFNLHFVVLIFVFDENLFHPDMFGSFAACWFNICLQYNAAFMNFVPSDILFLKIIFPIGFEGLHNALKLNLCQAL